MPHITPGPVIDAGFTHAGHTYRFHAYQTGGSPSVAIRFVDQNIRSLEESGVPPKFKELLSRNDGLILVTGPTGSGKSTTLASAINHLNINEELHIITLEDPREVIHHNKRSLVHQREFGRDFHSFADAIKCAMREDPDVILIGEMRDYETISAALTAAETGHLVFGTLHTATAPGAISRILDSAKDYEPAKMQAQLASMLLGVLAQRLPRTIEGKRCGAYELLVQTSATENLIRSGKTNSLQDEIARGSTSGMVAMDDYLQGLVAKRRISKEEAIRLASDPENLKKRLPLRN
jgi:twitching motility protein PilT